MHRPTQQASSLSEILTLLEKGKYPELVWVGKNYSKADLIRDLKKLAERV